MKKMVLIAVLVGFVFAAVSCVIVQAPARTAALDPDQILMQRMGRISEGMGKEAALNIISRKPSMVDEGQWYFYFEKERKAAGYPDYMQTGYLVEFSNGKVGNVEPLWRKK